MPKTENLQKSQILKFYGKSENVLNTPPPDICPKNAPGGGGI